MLQFPISHLHFNRQLWKLAHVRYAPLELSRIYFVPVVRVASWNIDHAYMFTYVHIVDSRGWIFFQYMLGSRSGKTRIIFVSAVWISVLDGALVELSENIHTCSSNIPVPEL